MNRDIASIRNQILDVLIRVAHTQLEYDINSLEFKILKDVSNKLIKLSDSLDIHLEVIHEIQKQKE